MYNSFLHISSQNQNKIEIVLNFVQLKFNRKYNIVYTNFNINKNNQIIGILIYTTYLFK